MLRGLGPIPNLCPMSPNSGLFPYSLAEAVPVQVPNAVDCGPAVVLTPGTCPGLVLEDIRMPTFTPRSPSDIAVITRLQTSSAETGPSCSQPMITTIHLFCAYGFHAAGFGHGDSATLFRLGQSDPAILFGFGQVVSAGLFGFGHDDSATPFGLGQIDPTAPMRIRPK